MSKVMERYSVKKDFHLSALGTMVRKDALIELHRSNRIMRINGSVVGTGDQDAVSEAIRVVTRMAEEPDAELFEKLPEIDSSRAPKTQTITAFPVIGCLKAVEEYTGGNKLTWTTVNDQQREFMELFFEKGMEGIEGLSDKEIRWMADKNASKINSWLQENGFDIRLSESPNPGGFSVASILDVLVDWMKEGKLRPVANDKGRFDGVFLKEGVSLLQNPHVHNHTVARIATRSGDSVYMTPIDELSGDKFALESKIRSIMVGLEHHDYRYQGVVFPMVDYDQEVDVSFLAGLRTGEFYVSEAIQQTKFRMNEIGARVESAMAMTLRKCSSNFTPPFVIDRPFALWISRLGVDMPLFGGVFAEDVWKNPGTLEDK